MIAQAGLLHSYLVNAEPCYAWCVTAVRRKGGVRWEAPFHPQHLSVTIATIVPRSSPSLILFCFFLQFEKSTFASAICDPGTCNIGSNCLTYLIQPGSSMWQFRVVHECRNREGSEASLCVQPVPPTIAGSEEVCTSLGVWWGGHLPGCLPLGLPLTVGHHRPPSKVPASEHCYLLS